MSKQPNPSTILSGASPALSASSASPSPSTLLSARPSSPLGRPGEVYGRTELAQMYFPYIQPRSAWLKLRSLLAEDPSLSHLTKLRRRTFLPSEVAKIYASLGHP